MFAPNDNPNYLGFSPKPTPKLIASYRSKARRWRFLRVSTGIAPSTKAETNWRSSIARLAALHRGRDQTDVCPSQQRPVLLRDK